MIFSMLQRPGHDGFSVSRWLAGSAIVLFPLLGNAACSSPASPEAIDVVSPGVIGPVEAESIAPQDAPPLTSRQRRQLDQFRANLTGPDDIDPEIRAGAAEELLLMRLPQAISLLDQALRGSRSPVILAVVQAMGNRVEPVAGLLEPAIFALTNAPSQVLDQLSMELTRFGTSAFQRVASLALDEDQPVAQRLGPIYALSVFQSRESAASLIDLLHQAPVQNNEIHNAACESLGNLTGVPYGTDVKNWLAWWEQYRDQPQDEWTRAMIQNLQSQNSDLNHQYTTLSVQHDAMKQRIIEVYTDLFPNLPPEAQLSKLPGMLEDPLVGVRRFAVERIDILRKDSATIPPELQEKLAERLNDPAASIRTRVAVLLDLLGDPNITDRIAQALPQETDQGVIESYLRILTANPSLAALESLCGLLDSPEHASLAADALWPLLTRAERTPEHLAAARQDLLPALAAHPSPPLVRLMAYLGDPPDRETLEGYLDGEDLELKQATAEGFARADHRQPLLDRAGDEAIYPYLLETLATSPLDLARFRTLALLRPTPTHQAIWEQAIRTAAGHYQPDNILDLEDVLSELEYAPIQLRSDVLGPVAVLSADQLVPANRPLIIGRWASLLLELGQAQRSYEALDTIGEIAAGSPLAQLKFQTALQTGNYEIAAQLDAQAQSWIDALSALSVTRPKIATPLRDEITRRFDGEIVGELKTAFDTAVANLPAPIPPPPDHNPPPSNSDAGGLRP